MLTPSDCLFIKSTLYCEEQGRTRKGIGKVATKVGKKERAQATKHNSATTSESWKFTANEYLHVTICLNQKMQKIGMKIW